MRRSWSYDDPRWLTADRVLAALLFLFFVYTVLLWRGVIGDGTAWSAGAGQMVLLAAAMLTQAIAALVQRRSRVAFYGLLAGSVVLLYLSVAAL
jgi:hypothetical protein